jgi:hypothetical protein
MRLSAVLLELPVSVVQWTDLSGLEPSGDAVEMERMLSHVSSDIMDLNARTHVADTPSDSAFLACSGSLVGLTLDAEVHDVVTADGAVVDDNVPSPESDRVPLCDVSYDLQIASPVV